jgi:hypothetical protein
MMTANMQSTDQLSSFDYLQDAEVDDLPSQNEQSAIPDPTTSLPIPAVVTPAQAIETNEALQTMSQHMCT